MFSNTIYSEVREVLKLGWLLYSTPLLSLPQTGPVQIQPTATVKSREVFPGEKLFPQLLQRSRQRCRTGS